MSVVGINSIDGFDLTIEPWKHSVHCMRDLQQCIDSGYVLLAENTETNTFYIA